MGGLKVHGHPISPASRRVVLCLEEKALDYDFQFVDMAAGQHKQQQFLSLNPFGQVPAFQDGDLNLFESRAITEYIARAYADKGTPLIPSDVKKLGVALAWAEVESHTFDSAAAPLSFELVVKPILGMPIDEAVVAENLAKLEKVLDVYEARLTTSKYLGGDDFTLADLHHIPIVNNLMHTDKVKPLFDGRLHVSAWSKDILARPAWQKTLDKMKL
uniref:glutathione transferase n=1 Tax=Acanthus ebracteatus TaxID=241842 RepID=A0MQ81_ACAEB|nr:glutathione-S-transferase [Acanthus ebracteatus]